MKNKKRITAKPGKSIFLQIILFGATLLLLLGAAYLGTLRYMGNMNRERTIEFNEQILRQVQDEAQLYYETLNHVATAFAYSPTVYEYLTLPETERITARSSLDDMYTNIVLLEDAITEVYLYGEGMEFLTSMGSRSGQYSGRYQQEYDTMTFSSLIREENTGLQRVALYFPVYDLDSALYGEMKGMCVFVMRTDRFDSMLDNTRITEGAQIYITDAGNKTVASAGGGPAYLDSSRMKSSGGYYTQTRELKMDGWKVVTRLPESSFYSLSGEGFRTVTAAYLLAAAVLAGFIYYCIRRLIRPVKQIDAFISGLAEAPESRLETKRQDEIGAVVKSLNRMLDDRERMNREKVEDMQKMHETELEKKQFQILAYRSQINPHFLYNTLDCIRGMALYHDADDIAEIVVALSRIFRYSIKGSSIVTVSEEIDHIREYARVIHYRFMDKIRVSVHMGNEAADKKIIKLILQPLVENAVLHGLEQTVAGGEVKVSVNNTGDRRLYITVEDNGCGIPGPRLDQIRKSLAGERNTKGIGLSNIYQRLRLYYGEKMDFQIESEEGKGTKITIQIPDQAEEGGEQSVHSISGG